MQISVERQPAGYWVGVRYGRRGRVLGVLMRRPLGVARALPALRYLIRKRRPLAEIRDWQTNADVWAAIRGERG